MMTMTPPKKWPKNAEWARLDGIALALEIQEILRPVRDETETMSISEIVRRTGQAIDCLHELQRKLRSVGPGVG